MVFLPHPFETTDVQKKRKKFPKVMGFIINDNIEEPEVEIKELWQDIICIIQILQSNFGQAFLALCLNSIYTLDTVVQQLSCMCLFVTPCDPKGAHQAPSSVEFSRQYWNELPFSTPGDLTDPRIQPRSLASPALAGRFFITKLPGQIHCRQIITEKRLAFTWR